MPKELRQKWLPKMRHPKIKYLFTSTKLESEGGKVLHAFHKKLSSAPASATGSSLYCHEETQL
jgi:hypothetical protein